jgi:hypothetical protein
MATLILTAGDPAWSVPASAVTNKIYGSSWIDEITLAAGAKAELFGFRNGDILSLQGGIGEFTVYNSGSTVTLQDGSGTQVTLAAGLDPTTINFADQSTTLLIDPTQGILLGNQPVTQTPAPVTLNAPPATPILDDYGDTAADATLITSGAAGSIEEAYDTDWFKLDLTTDKVYTFDLFGSSSNSLTDPVLTLYDAAGNTLAHSDNANGGLDSQISDFTPTTNGTFFLEARAYNDLTGSYQLDVTEAPITLPTPAPTTAAGFDYTLNYTNYSAFGNYASQVDSGIKAALDYWGQFLNTSPYADLDIQVSYAPQSGDLLASAGSMSYWDGYEPTFNGLPIAKNTTAYELQTGTGSNYQYDTQIEIATSDLSVWWFDPTPFDRQDNTPNSGQQDFVGVMLHEFAHALGLSSTYQYTSYSGLGHYASYYTPYDTFVDWSANQTEFYFTGTNANRVYVANGGTGFLPLYVEPDEQGSSFSHYDGNTSNGAITADMLMNPSIERGTTLDISALDLAMLEDLGYDVNYDQLSNGAPQASYNGAPVLEAIGIASDELPLVA